MPEYPTLKRVRILVVTAQPPRMPGMGGEVRTYYCIKAATELGDVTLVSLGGFDGNLAVQQDIAESCNEVIQPSTRDAPVRSAIARGRLISQFKTLSVLLMPWRKHWSDFLDLYIQYCPPSTVKRTVKTRAAKRLLAGVLQMEFGVTSRFFNLPPLTVHFLNEKYKAIEPDVVSMLQRKHFDLVWIENTITYPFARKLLNSLKGRRPYVLCNAQNIETLVQQRIANNSKTVEERRYNQRQTDLMRRMEIEAYRESDLVIQCSEQDAKLGREMVPETTFCVVGNGVNVDYFQSSANCVQSERPTVVFTAGFGYGPNREGLAFFIRDVFPLIQQQCPECQLVFAGSQAHEMIVELQIDNPAIRCVSSPDDIRPYFEMAWVYVVPLLAGGGTRLKILEAMSMRRAIVSTSLGAEGIPCKNGTHLVLADDAEAFAREVVALLSSPERRELLQSAAFDWVRSNYNWDILSDLIKLELRGRFPDLFGQSLIDAESVQANA